jgi:ferric-dicitrate binding protein FerR (iron transport regulator)
MNVSEIKERWQDLYHVPEDDERASLARKGQQRREFTRRAALSGIALVLLALLLGLLVYYAGASAC